MEPSRLQGRLFEASHLAEVCAVIGAHPDWSRYRLSQFLCTQWDWRNAMGQPKDMAARTLLAKLAQRGWVELPVFWSG